jgi:hypothetical protein
MMELEFLVVLIAIVVVSYIIAITIALLMLMVIHLREQSRLKEIPKRKRRNETW